jgi:drug/metabolite transporter (DMT)-like permease
MLGLSGLHVMMLVMLMSGTANTLLMKFMCRTEVATGPSKAVKGFDHPYFQTLLMMIGEFLCLLVYYGTRKSEDVAKASQVPKAVFAVACLFDWTATTLVNMAYSLIAASVVQMTRGAIVIFTCILSVVFLGRKQHPYHLVGVGMVFVGITLVSVSAFTNPDPAVEEDDQGNNKILLGIMLCVVAQVFQAAMIVYEEKIMSQYPCNPLQVVGFEGLFGIIVGIVLLLILNPMGVESTPEAVYQMRNSAPLGIACLASIFSIAFFNFSGVTVTQQASAVSRSTIDVSRTVLIWVVELILHWNDFNTLQLIGFIVLAIGTLIYNRLVVIQALEPSEESKSLMGAEADVIKDTLEDKKSMA